MGWFSKPKKSEWEVSAKALREMTHCSALASPAEVCRAIKTMADARDAYMTSLERSNIALGRATKKLDEAESKIGVLRGIIDHSLAAIDFPKDFDVSKLPAAIKDQTEHLWDLAQKRAKQENELANATHKLEVLQQAHEALQKALTAERMAKASPAFSKLREALNLNASTPDERVGPVAHTTLASMMAHNDHLESENHDLTHKLMKAHKDFTTLLLKVSPLFAGLREALGLDTNTSDEQVLQVASKGLSTLINHNKDFEDYKRHAEAELLAKHKDLKDITEASNQFRKDVLDTLGDVNSQKSFEATLSLVKVLKSSYDWFRSENGRMGKQLNALREEGKFVRDQYAQFRFDTAKALGLPDEATEKLFADTDLQRIPTGVRAAVVELRAVKGQRDALLAEIEKVKDQNTLVNFRRNVALALGYSENEAEDFAEGTGSRCVLDDIKSLKQALEGWKDHSYAWRDDFFEACKRHKGYIETLKAARNKRTEEFDTFRDDILVALGRPQPPASSSEDNTTKPLAWIVDLVRERGNVKTDEVQEFQRCWKECAALLDINEKTATEILETRGPTWLVESFGRLKSASKAYEEHARKTQVEADESRKQVEALTLDVDRQTKRLHLFVKKIRDILVMPLNWSYDMVIDALVLDASSCVKLRDSRIEEKKRKTCLLFEFPNA